MADEKYYIATPIFCLTDGSHDPSVVGTMEGGQITLVATSTLQDLEREINKQMLILQGVVQTPVVCRGCVVKIKNGVNATSLSYVGLRLAQ